MNIPKDTQHIISILSTAGYDAYVVGGCVRDYIMNRPCQDIDITTNALPNEIEQVLGDNSIKFVEVGIKHGTVTAIINGCSYEITTFRTDGEYLDSRHPENVKFVSDIAEDLARRDFTINAIAYNDKNSFVDKFGGIDDINKKLIKAVGNPDLRFKEDALRIMRALRFASTLGFDIEENTKKAIFDNKALLLNVSSERIFVELSKLVMGDNVENVLIEYKDILAVVIPELKYSFDFPQNSKWHLYDVFTHTAKSIAITPNKLYLRIAMLFHDCGKPFAKTVDAFGQDHFKGHPIESCKLADKALKRLKVSNELYQKVITLIEIHDMFITKDKADIKHWMNKIGADMTIDYIDFKIADLKTHNLLLTQNEIDELYHIKNIALEIIKNNEPYNISDLDISGNDLLQLGYSGKDVGKQLNNLLNSVIENPNLNTKKQLIDIAKSKKP